MQGKEPQEWSQYFPSRLLQKRKAQFRLHLVLGVRQPSHLFLSRTYPIQSRQFIPHGAMSDTLVRVVMSALLVLPGALAIPGTSNLIPVSSRRRGVGVGFVASLAWISGTH